MAIKPAIRLLRGHTTHERSMPFTHRFKYGLSMIEVDIDRLDEAATSSRLFSFERINLFSFRRRDHGDRQDVPLRPWAEEQFAKAGIDLQGGAIRLVTYPRHLFYKFAPISLWLGYGLDGELRGILYEVNNTFGETHTYAATTPDAPRSQHQTDQVFHVSPFFDVSGRYEFTLRDDDKRLSLMVATQTQNGQQHLATIMARKQPLTSAQLLWITLTKPFSTLSVTLAIHWQAFRIWLKGARYHSKPKQAEPRITIATQAGDSPAREKAA